MAICYPLSACCWSQNKWRRMTLSANFTSKSVFDVQGCRAHIYLTLSRMIIVKVCRRLAMAHQSPYTLIKHKNSWGGRFKEIRGLFKLCDDFWPIIQREESVIGYWRHIAVRPSVRPSVCLWRCALWLNDATAKVSEQVNRKCLPIETRRFKISTHTANTVDTAGDLAAIKLPAPKISNAVWSAISATTGRASC